MKELNTKKKLVKAITMQDTSPWTQPTSWTTEAITNRTQNKHRHKSEIERFNRKKNGALWNVALRAMVTTTSKLPRKPNKSTPVNAVTYSAESMMPQDLSKFKPLASRVAEFWCRVSTVLLSDTHPLQPGWNRQKLMIFTSVPRNCLLKCPHHKDIAHVTCLENFRINSEHRLYKSQTRLKSAAKKYRLILSILALSLIEGRFGFDFSSIVRRIAEKAIFREMKKLQPQLGRPGDAFPRKQAQ